MLVGRPAIRLFVLLVAAALPPLGACAWLAAVHPAWLDRLGGLSEALLLAMLAILWSGFVAVTGGRLVEGTVRALLDLAPSGQSRSGVEPRLSGAVERMASALEERNRQITELASHVRAAPIEQALPAVARATVDAAVSVTGDPTWQLAVLRSPDPSAVPPGIYVADEHVGPVDVIRDVHRWAATMEPDDEATPSVRHGEGPWGAFVSVEVAAGDDLRASLLAPWEGRSSPSRTERELLSLLGQNAATALEHAILYARLRSQTDELNRMAQVQSDFLRGVTHDLQTPLTSIGALASELRERRGLSQSSRSDLDTIGHQAERLRRMVGQLLVASRLEAGAVQPNLEVFRVEPLIRRTWAALRADRPFTLEAAEDSQLTVGDPDRLEQVLWALLDNAVKYSPDGSPISVSVSSAADPAGSPQSVIRVRDAGSGMDDETRARAFEQFYRAAAARRSAPDGSGVGLYAARGLVVAMGGTLEIASRLGQGTEMILMLPAEPFDDDPAAAH